MIKSISKGNKFLNGGGYVDAAEFLDYAKGLERKIDKLDTALVKASNHIFKTSNNQAILNMIERARDND